MSDQQDTEELIPAAGINNLLREYGHWFHDVMRTGFYTKGATKDSLIAPEGDIPSHLHRTQKALQDAAHVFAQKQDPEMKSFDDFAAIYIAFAEQMRSLIMLHGDRLRDPVTGLYDQSVMMEDLKVEMDRLDRQGQPFALVLAAIDDFGKLQKDAGIADANAALNLVGQLILKSVRSFDQAYYAGENAFVICLKDADVPSGLSALDRIRAGLIEAESQASISFSITEPGPGTDVLALVGDLKRDLNSTEKAPGVVIEHSERSALERYAKEEGL